MTIFAGDNLPLFSNSDAAANRAGRKRACRLEARAAAAANGSASTMKKAKLDPTRLCQFDQGDKC